MSTTSIVQIYFNSISIKKMQNLRQAFHKFICQRISHFQKTMKF